MNGSMFFKLLLPAAVLIPFMLSKQSNGSKQFEITGIRGGVFCVRRLHIIMYSPVWKILILIAFVLV